QRRRSRIELPGSLRLAVEGRSPRRSVPKRAGRLDAGDTFDKGRPEWQRVSLRQVSCGWILSSCVSQLSKCPFSWRMTRFEELVNYFLIGRPRRLALYKGGYLAQSHALERIW